MSDPLPVPVQGQQLIAADGTIYVVTSFTPPDPEIDADEDFDPDWFLVEVCALADLNDMQVPGYEFDNVEFQEFCDNEGIRFGEVMRIHGA